MYAIIRTSKRKQCIVELGGQVNVIDGIELDPAKAKTGRIIMEATTNFSAIRDQFVALTRKTKPGH